MAGMIAPVELPRLAESEVVTTGLEFELRGLTNRAGFPALALKIHGHATMPCQRCLEPCSLEISVDCELELRASREEIETTDDDVDRTLASKSMSVAALIEDEAMLVLPMIARHQDWDPGCLPVEATVGSLGAGSLGPTNPNLSNPSSPFASLGRRKS